MESNFGANKRWTNKGMRIRLWAYRRNEGYQEKEVYAVFDPAKVNGFGVSVDDKPKKGGKEG